MPLYIYIYIFFFFWWRALKRSWNQINILIAKNQNPSTDRQRIYFSNEMRKSRLSDARLLPLRWLEAKTETEIDMDTYVQKDP